MSGKGSGRRPQKVDEQTFASNWERIFSGCSTAASASAGELMGRGVVANMSLSKSEALGSEPSAPANQGDE